MKENLKAWAIAAGMRALKTVAETAVAMIPAGVAFNEVGWMTVVSTSLLAGVLSILTAIKGLPEVEDGASIMKLMNAQHVKEETEQAE